ncbi:protein priA [Desarmillaria ectypa]|nr:protein priA [Desarmillaria ectypa]
MQFIIQLALIAMALPLVTSNGGSGGSSSCSKNEFWYEDTSCCLPTGGPPSKPSPPKDHNCPTSTHYWNKDNGCCVPSHPPTQNQPPPQCPSGWDWYQGPHVCLPHPTPSNPPSSHPSGYHGGHRKRDIHKSRSASLCPFGLDACPIAGLTGNGDYECIDTSSDLEACGGCPSLGQGEDCTAISGAWNVACENRRCQVYTCVPGYTRSSDGKSCVAL